MQKLQWYVSYELKTLILTFGTVIFENLLARWFSIFLIHIGNFIENSFSSWDGIMSFPRIHPIMRDPPATNVHEILIHYSRTLASARLLNPFLTSSNVVFSIRKMENRNWLWQISKPWGIIWTCLLRTDRWTIQTFRRLFDLETSHLTTSNPHQE